MPHIFFFSYASENWSQPGLDEFYDDLCKAVAPLVKWKYDSPMISFRDHNMRLGEEWKPAIADALQDSVVLVSIVSEAYFSKEFCGQEVYIFDQRRRQGLAPGNRPPQVILPVIWAPVEQGYPNVLGNLQADQAGMPKDYFDKGLYKLKILDKNTYNACVLGFADSIHTTWRQYSKKDPFDPRQWACTIPRVPIKELGPSIPNEFGLGDWKEAVGPKGWLEGPDVVNFVFAAGVKAILNKPRYGDQPGHWQPYFPPSFTPISKYAADAAHKRRNGKFREIPLSPDIGQDLAEAKERKNLTLVVADPESLTLPQLNPVRSHDDLAWEGTAVLLPCDDLQTWQDTNVQTEVLNAFPKHAKVAGTAYPGRIESSEELESKLDSVLSELYSAVLKSMAKGLPVTDVAPTQLAATTETKQP